MQQTVTIDEFVHEYTRLIKHRLRSHAQIKRHLDRIANHFRGRDLQSIRKHDVQLYAEERQTQGVKTASINIELAALSASINYAKRRWEIDITNPVSGLFYPQGPGRLRFLEKHEAATLIKAARQTRSPILAHLIELALNTGARKNELLQLKFQSIDLTRKIITIQAETTKTGKRRYLPINQAASEVLLARQAYRDKYCPGSQWVFCNKTGNRTRQPDNTFRRIVQEAGIQNFCFHDLRHTFASWLVTEGVELIKVRDLLGHSSIRMTERYAHLAPFRLHEAVAVLDGYCELHDNGAD